jgi:hypothetical protein
MPRLVRLSVVLLGALGLIACDQSPVTPAATVNPTSIDARAPSTPPGFYEMTFLNSAREEVTSLPAGLYTSHVLIRVHVEDSNHQPAQTGSVLYEMCQDKATGKGMPTAACAEGTARWTRWVNIRVSPSGDTWAGIDIVLNPCTIGFRATYGGSKTIAPGSVGPVDFSWTAP